MDIKHVAAILLVGRLVSASFIFFVLRKQLELFKYPIDPEISNFRKVLFGVAVVIFLGSIIPMGVDVLTILADNSLLREDNVSNANMFYAFTNVITATVSSLFIWLLYRLAGRTADTTTYDTSDALTLSDKQYKDKK